MGRITGHPIDAGGTIGGHLDGTHFPFDVSADLSPVAKADIAAAMQGCSDSIGEQIDELTESVNHGFVQRHEHGAMFWKLHVGAHCVSDDIYDFYLLLGGERDFLGYPIGNEELSPDQEALFAVFEHGAIYQSPHGLHEIHGAIYQKWKEFSGDRFLGYPTTDETPTSDSIGRFSDFSRGSIYWHPTFGAHDLRDKIRDRYRERGAERSYLGYPTQDERTVNAQVRVSRFQRGEIALDAFDRVGDIADSVEFAIDPIITEDTIGGSLVWRMNSRGDWNWHGAIKNTGILDLSVGVASALKINVGGQGFGIGVDTVVPGVVFGSNEFSFNKGGLDESVIRDNWDAILSTGIITRVEVGVPVSAIMQVILIPILVVGTIVFFASPGTTHSRRCPPRPGDPESDQHFQFWKGDGPPPECGP